MRRTRLGLHKKRLLQRLRLLLCRQGGQLFDVVELVLLLLLLLLRSTTLVVQLLLLLPLLSVCGDETGTRRR